MLIHPDPHYRLQVQSGWTLVAGQPEVSALFEATDQFHDGHLLEMFYLPLTRGAYLPYARMLVCAPYAKPGQLVELFFFGVGEFSGQVEEYVEADDVALSLNDSPGTYSINFKLGRLSIRAHHLLWRLAPEWQDSPRKSQYLDPNLPLEVGDPLGLYLHG